MPPKESSGGGGHKTGTSSSTHPYPTHPNPPTPPTPPHAHTEKQRQADKLARQAAAKEKHAAAPPTIVKAPSPTPSGATGAIRAKAVYKSKEEEEKARAVRPTHHPLLSMLR